MPDDSYMKLETPQPCFICGKPSDWADLAFEAPLHPECEHKINPLEPEEGGERREPF